MRRWLVCLLLVAGRAAVADPAQDHDACLRAADALAAPIHSDPFAANTFADAVMALHGCQGDWQKVCLPRVLQALPQDLDALANKVDEIGKRYFDVDGPARCPVQGDANPETVRQIRFWCRNTQEQCENPQFGPSAGQPVLDVANREAACVAQLDWSDQQAQQRAKCEQDYQTALQAQQQQQQAEREREQQQQEQRQAAQREQAAQAEAARAKAEADEQARQQQIQQEREQKAADQRTENAQAAAANADAASTMVSMMAAGHGGGNAPRGTTWYLHFGGGGGIFASPLFVNEAAASDGVFSLPASTDTSQAITIGPSARLALWPYYSPHAGIGVETAGAVGGMALPGGGMLTLEGMAGLRAYAGSLARWSVFGELGMGYRAASVSQSEQDDASTGVITSGPKDGSASYEYTRYGIGARKCLRAEEADSRFCELDTSFEYLQETVPYSSDTATLYRLGLEDRRVVGLFLTMGFDYPTPGDNMYMGTPGHQFSFAVSVEWSIDHFGAPFHHEDEVAVAASPSAAAASAPLPPQTTSPRDVCSLHPDDVDACRELAAHGATEDDRRFGEESVIQTLEKRCSFQDVASCVALGDEYDREPSEKSSGVPAYAWACFAGSKDACARTCARNTKLDCAPAPDKRGSCSSIHVDYSVEYRCDGADWQTFHLQLDGSTGSLEMAGRPPEAVNVEGCPVEDDFHLDNGSDVSVMGVGLDDPLIMVSGIQLPQKQFLDSPASRFCGASYRNVDFRNLQSKATR